MKKIDTSKWDTALLADLHGVKRTYTIRRIVARKRWEWA